MRLLYTTKQKVPTQYETKIHDFQEQAEFRNSGFVTGWHYILFYYILYYTFSGKNQNDLKSTNKVKALMVKKIVEFV